MALGIHCPCVRRLRGRSYFLVSGQQQPAFWEITIPSVSASLTTLTSLTINIKFTIFTGLVFIIFTEVGCQGKGRCTKEREDGRKMDKVLFGMCVFIYFYLFSSVCLEKMDKGYLACVSTRFGDKKLCPNPWLVSMKSITHLWLGSTEFFWWTEYFLLV